MDHLLVNPLRGLFLAIASIERNRAAGDLEMAHSESDLLANALISEGVFLDVAEALALALVGEDADAMHLGMLAKIRHAQGRQAEGAELEKAAASAPDNHTTPAGRARVREALKKHGIGEP